MDDISCEFQNEIQQFGIETEISKYAVIESNVKIGVACKIFPFVYIPNNVSIGNKVIIKNSCNLIDNLKIGDNVEIGGNLNFIDSPDCINQETIIENNVKIESSVMILKGVKIGQNAMVKAGSLVSKSVPSNAIVTGNPIRIIGYTNAFKIHHFPEQIKSSLNLQKSIVDGIKLVVLNKIKDIRGDLIVGEFEKQIPFAVKRYFMIYGVPSFETRGEHAHKSCKQFLVVIKGSINVIVDNGKYSEEYVLDDPSFGLYIPEMVWGVQYKYSKDAILLVFASEHYSSDDYIRTYNEYLDYKEISDVK